MGGRPILALAILGWPVDKLSEEVAALVMQGGRDACAEAGIPLAGGHSIDNLEPLFGLAVNGLVPRKNLKRNDTGCAGDLLYITKPLGTGIIATAIKRQKATPEHIQLVTKNMSTLNKIGEVFGGIPAISAMTDVTGFGLAGHLLEMCKGANLSAELWFDALPTLPREVLQPYIDAFILPDNTFRNYQSYNQDISTLTGAQLPILCDPQTSGGLLIAVNPAYQNEIEALLKKHEMPHVAIGKLTEKQEKRIVVV
jgi:selenide,water dikinase